MPPIDVDSMHAKPRSWTATKRVLFRFAFCYWFLYFLPSYGAASLFDLIPFAGDKLSEWIAWPLARLSHHVGAHFLLGQAADWHPTGSGDTAMHYTLLLCVFVLAVLSSLAWSAISEIRKTRREYSTAYAFLRVFLRFTLAVTLLGYGFAKVFPSQFGYEPSLFHMNERWGESSPMHVLWMFMGVSRPYTIFGGLAEVIPGVLLLFRRTTTIGLLGSAAVMVNVVVLNFTYDVPVKIYSTNLLLLSLFLLLPDMVPMWRFFVLRRPAELIGVQLLVTQREPLRICAHVLQGLVVVGCAWIGFSTWQSREMPWEHSPIYGVWKVDSASDPGTAFQTPTTLVMDRMTQVDAVEADGTPKHYPVKYDPASRIVRFTKMDRDTFLQWTSLAANKLMMQGKWLGTPVKLVLVRTSPTDYPLRSRGFHWVQEMPYNR